MADLSISLGIPSIELITQTSDKEGNIILIVKSIKGGCTCYKCGKIATHGEKKLSVPVTCFNAESFLKKMYF